MEVDVKELLIDLNFFAGDMRMRNMSGTRIKTRSEVDQLFDIPMNLKFSSFPTITWLKTQVVNVREILRELELVSIDSYDAGLYNTGEELLKRLSQVTEPYTQSYVAFQLLVNKTTYRNFRGKDPAQILLNLAEGSYDLSEAIDEFSQYLDQLERQPSVDHSAHVKQLREELEELDILRGLD